jgi:hypothetical protein
MFLIVHEDKPIFEMELSAQEMSVKEYFLVHAALDNIDLAVRSKKDYFLGQVKSDDLALYAFVNAVRNTRTTQKSSSSSCSDRRRKLIRDSRGTSRISSPKSMRPSPPASSTPSITLASTCDPPASRRRSRAPPRSTSGPSSPKKRNDDDG